MSQTFTAIDIPQKPGGFGTSAGGGGKSPGRPSGDKPGRSHQAEKMGPPARKENKKKSSLRRASKTSAKGSGLNEQAGSSSVFLGSSDEDIYPSASQPLRSKSTFLS